jgi:hypothetical protein
MLRGARRVTLFVAGVALAVGLLASAAPAGATVTSCPAPVIGASTATVTCSYTGAAQTWVVPAGVSSATFDVYGAQGGGALNEASGFPKFTPGGKGAHVSATLSLTPGQSLEIMVGGAGGACVALPDSGAGGFNGGGAGLCGLVSGSGGAGGGGASDVRTGTFTLAERVLVAAGGGAAAVPISHCNCVGGVGGDSAAAAATGPRIPQVTRAPRPLRSLPAMARAGRRAPARRAVPAACLTAAAAAARPRITAAPAALAPVSALAALAVAAAAACTVAVVAAAALPRSATSAPTKPPAAAAAAARASGAAAR